MGYKKELLAVVRKPNYNNTIKLFQTPLSNEEILNNIGLITVSSNFSDEWGKISDYNDFITCLNENPQRAYILDIQSIIMELTSAYGVVFVANQELQDIIIERVYHHFYSEEGNRYFLESCQTLILAGNDKYRESVCRRGLTDWQKYALTSNNLSSFDINTIQILYIGCPYNCQLKDDLREHINHIESKGDFS